MGRNPHSGYALRSFQGRCMHNLLCTKHFHEVPSASLHAYSLKSRHGKVRHVLCSCLQQSPASSHPTRGQPSVLHGRTLLSHLVPSWAGGLTHEPGPPRRTAVASSCATPTARARRPPESAACCPAGSAAPLSEAAT